MNLRKLHEAATPGPWRRDHNWIGMGTPEGMYSVGEVADAVLIAATRNALPFLLDVVEAARSAAGECAEWTEYQYGNPSKIIDAIEPRLRNALDALDAHLAES